jgi:hypothetical protein
VKKLIRAGLVAPLGLTPTVTRAQTQTEEKVILCEVQNVDASGTQITLTEGTVLLTPPGAMLRPGAIQQGMQVVALYREQQNGEKVLTRLAPGR